MRRAFPGLSLMVALLGGLWLAALPGAQAAPLGRPTVTVPPLPTVTPTWEPGEGMIRLGISGGVFACDAWEVTIPAGVPPEGARLHCGAFDPSVAPAAPAGHQLLRRTINVTLYDPAGQWLTDYILPLTICAPLRESDLAVGSNLVIVSASVGGAWTSLNTTVSVGARQACAPVERLALFDLAVRIPAASTVDGAGESVYTVQPGDTLYGIARRRGLTVAALQAANALSGVFIYPGQVLNLPASAMPGTAPAPTPVASATARPAGGRWYQVQAGDNLFRIALRHGVTLDALRAANNLTHNWIYPGQVLLIP